MHRRRILPGRRGPATAAHGPAAGVSSRYGDTRSSAMRCGGTRQLVGGERVVDAAEDAGLVAGPGDVVPYPAHDHESYRWCRKAGSSRSVVLADVGPRAAKTPPPPGHVLSRFGFVAVNELDLVARALFAPVDGDDPHPLGRFVVPQPVDLLVADIHGAPFCLLEHHPPRQRATGLRRDDPRSVRRSAKTASCSSDRGTNKNPSADMTKP